MRLIVIAVIVAGVWAVVPVGRFYSPLQTVYAVEQALEEQPQVKEDTENKENPDVQPETGITKPEEQPQVAESGNDKEIERMAEIDLAWQRKVKIIVVAIFCVLLILCGYWWTYGRLHHKVPKY